MIHMGLRQDEGRGSPSVGYRASLAALDLTCPAQLDRSTLDR